VKNVVGEETLPKRKTMIKHKCGGEG